MFLFCHTSIVLAQTNKTIDANVSAVKAIIDLIPDSITVNTSQGLYYLYLAHTVPTGAMKETNYYLMLSQNAEIYQKFKVDSTPKIITLEGAEIDPLDKFYKEVIKNSPANFKTALKALNAYRMFRIFNYNVLYLEPLKIDTGITQNINTNTNPSTNTLSPKPPH